MRIETLIVSLLASSAVAGPMTRAIVEPGAAMQVRDSEPATAPAPLTERDLDARDPKSPNEVKEDLKKKLEDAKKHRPKLPKLPGKNTTKPGKPPVKPPVKKEKRAVAELFSDPKVPFKPKDPKKADPKKADPKKADPKKDDPKKQQPKIPGGKNNTKPIEAPKKSDPKKSDPKKDDPKKQQPKRSVNLLEERDHKGGEGGFGIKADKKKGEKKNCDKKKGDRKKGDRKKGGRKPHGNSTRTGVPEPKVTEPASEPVANKRSLPIRLPAIF